MSSRARAAMPTAKTPPKSGRDHLRVEKEKELKAEMSSHGSRLMNLRNASGGQRSRRERKAALKQDVDKLKKKLWREENVHRVLERAFTRPLGTLPRLPPYLPPQMLELLAEVAVLEEEVVRLEEQVVNFRWGLYQEAIYISSSKKAIENAYDMSSGVNKSEQSKSSPQCGSSENSTCNDQSSPSQSSSGADHNGISCSPLPHGKRLSKRSSSFSNDQCGKENQLLNNSTSVRRQSPQKRVSSITKTSDAKLDCKGTHIEKVEDNVSSPNRISEDLLKCFFSIFSKMCPLVSKEALIEMVPSVSGFHESVEDLLSRDPYGICPLFGRRDIGPYKNFRSINKNTVDRNLVDSSTLIRRLRFLLRKLELVDLRGLNHQEKLAFWINIYNSCMMNAFLENGIPVTPQMVVTLMQKAMINVGGHVLKAMMIEHFILRLPFDSKFAFSKVSKNDEMATRSNLGLDWPEPLVTFALSCGSWSSPAVRVYTASQVENELEIAKRDYLQAAIGISPKNKLAIPKLLDWYLLDFAKDIESLLDWICLQLPSGLRNDAVKCIERGRRGAFPSQNVQVLPYEFSFRYLLAT